MTSILRLTAKLISRQNCKTDIRPISLYAKLQTKEILEIKQGNELIIEAIEVPSINTPYLVKADSAHQCPLCSLNLDVKHTDVLILSQYVRSDGCMLPRRITGLCRNKQKTVSSLVTMAQKAGLMPNLNPASSKKDPKKRYGFKKFNKYFDESTIKIR